MKWLLVLFLFSSFALWLDRVTLTYPSYWPKPYYNFKNNPLTKQKIALGRKLFYDPILSLDSSISCSSCHLSFTAFTHVDHALSHGIQDRIGTRNSPTLQNLAWSSSFMWDGGVNHLDIQSLFPITHPDEMGENLPHVIEKLNKQPVYQKLFQQAFHSEEITGEYLFKALSQFMLTLVSKDSKYDQVKAGKNHFNEQEERGYRIFQQQCQSCHQEPLFTNHGFASNGLLPDTNLKDIGRMRITQSATDRYQFKIPTLRNIEFSYPYMHDGRFPSLMSVLNFYQSKGSKNEHTAPEIHAITFTDVEKIDLYAFLLTLSDRTFLFNPQFQGKK